MPEQPDISDDIDISRDELEKRLESRDADELRELLLDVAESGGRAQRLLHLETLEEGQTPDVDLEAFRERAESIFLLFRGAFGKPEARDDYACERDMRTLLQEVRDYYERGFYDVAAGMARVLLDVLEDHRDQLNPHRGWSQDVEWELQDMYRDED